MKIFIWKSYGDVKVYNAENVETLKYVYDAIVSVLERWNMDAELAQVYARLNRNLSEVQDNEIPKCYRIAINMLLDLIAIGSDESFEYGTGFSTLQTK